MKEIVLAFCLNSKYEKKNDLEKGGWYKFSTSILSRKKTNSKEIKLFRILKWKEKNKFVRIFKKNKNEKYSG